MSHSFFIGIDVSKATFNVAVKVKGQWIESVFDNSLSGYKQFVSWLNRKQQVGLVCLESTGPYGEPLAEYLYAHGIEVSMVNPMQIKHYSKSLLTRNKNDIVDARVIALYAEKSPSRLFKPKTKAQNVY